MVSLALLAQLLSWHKKSSMQRSDKLATPVPQYRLRLLQLLLFKCVRFSCCSPIASTAAPQLRQLLLLDCIKCCSLIVSTAAPRLRQLLLLDCIKCCSLIVSTAAPRLRQLLLLDCVLPWISMHSPQLHVHVLLPDLNYCFPIASDSAVTHELHLLPLLLPDHICFFSGCAHKSCSRYTKRTRAGSGHDIWQSLYWTRTGNL